MADVRDIIEASLRKIGVLAEGESATAGGAADALGALGRLIDQWAAENLTVHTYTRTVFALTANDGEYSIGSGGNIAITRPVYIGQINLLDTAADPDTETPLVRLSEAEYASIPQKAQTADRPSHWYYNPTMATGTLTLWPVPTGSYSIALYVPTQLTEYSALSTTVSLPPGYRRMLVANLAVELAPDYRVPVDPELKQQAMDSKNVVKRSNRRWRELSFEASAGVQNDGVSYDILSDRSL